MDLKYGWYVPPQMTSLFYDLIVFYFKLFYYCFNVLGPIKEAIYIRVNYLTLKRNTGKYNLPHIRDKVLFSISELKTNK